jgi:hypothetical protein
MKRVLKDAFLHLSFLTHTPQSAISRLFQCLQRLNKETETQSATHTSFSLSSQNEENVYSFLYLYWNEKLFVIMVWNSFIKYRQSKEEAER